MDEHLSGKAAVAANGGKKVADPQASGFDFLHGRWSVRHRKLRERMADCTDWFEFPGTLEVGPILGGLGNFDRNLLDDPTGAYEAHSLRVFAPASGRWSIWWLDGRDPGAGLGPVLVGGFEAGKGTFLGEDMFQARAIQVRTTYQPLDDRRAQWTQAFRSEDRPDWEVNWVMDFARIGS
jgi:hypothetical protein